MVGERELPREVAFVMVPPLLSVRRMAGHKRGGCTGFFLTRTVYESAPFGTINNFRMALCEKIPRIGWPVWSISILTFEKLPSQENNKVR